MKKLTLGAKIATGFGLLIVIALLLGGLAVFNMKDVSQKSTMLAREYVPEVNVATEIRGAANRLMYDMRGYGFTENEKFFKDAQKELAAMQKALGQGRDLAAKASHLKKLSVALANIEKSQTAYGQAMDQTKTTVTRLHGFREELDKNAGLYMKASDEFLASQNKAFLAELAERQKKVALVGEMVDLGSETRVMNFKGQVDKDYETMARAIAKLDKAASIIGELNKIVRGAEDIKRMKTAEMAARGYKSAMRDFLAEFKKGDNAVASTLAALRMSMDSMARMYVKACDEFNHGQLAKLNRAMSERHSKINLANQVIDLGNDTRVKAFKSQALRDPALMEAAQKNFPAMDAKFAELKKITRDKEDLAHIDEVAAAAKGYSQAMASFLAGWRQLQVLGDKRDALGNSMIKNCADLTAAGLGHTGEMSTDAMRELDNASFIMLVGLALALVIGAVLAFLITKSITRPVHKVIAGLAEGSELVASAASQVSNASQSLAEGASQQAASLEETSSSMEEMSGMTKQNADNAGQADSLSNEARQVVERANRAMQKLTGSMEEIQKAGEETGKIIKTIDEIAFQTNLLALNAAVEAARAGEAGAGFAVVAEEVRNLAMRAAEAAKTTSQMIQGTIAKTNEGFSIVNETNQAFAEVANTTAKVGELVGEIAAASREQASGIDQVNKAMTEMDKVTQLNAANAEESAAASEELSSQAETMTGFVADLVAIAGGANRNAIGKKQLAQSAPPRALPPAAPRPAGRKKQAAAATNGQDPKKLIPLEDGDFQDF